MPAMSPESRAFPPVASPRIKDEAMDDGRLDGQDGLAFKNIDWATQERDDARAIEKFFSSHEMPSGVADFGSKEIDQKDKADDAIDFEDLDDDDLASEGGSTGAGPDAGPSQVPGLTEDEDTSHNTEYMDDLFGGGDGDNDLMPSSPPPDAAAADQDARALLPKNEPENEPDLPPDEIDDEAWGKMSLQQRQALNFPATEGPSIDKWLIQTNNEDPAMPAVPQTTDELIAEKFPLFEPHTILYYNRLFPEWPAEFLYKEPANIDKNPPEFAPTKLELELDADSSKLFRIPATSLSGNQRLSLADRNEWGNTIGAPALVYDRDFSDSESEGEAIGGFTLDEIATVFDESYDHTNDANAHADEEMDDWDREFLTAQPKKKRRFEPGLPDITSYDAWGISNYETATRRAAKRVFLDPNDPYLLIEEVSERPSKRPKIEEKTKRMANGQLRRDVLHYFNNSNDEAYEALKANHKNKVRATLSNLSVEHSLPALKLTFPFYRTKVDCQPWEHHRRNFELDKIVRHVIGVRKPSKVRKKEMRGKSIQDIYRTTKDLTMNDNSTVLLFEYSEQYPTILNNYGMSSRVINYHRRKDTDDEEKLPKLDIGETQPLMKEDRSPFSIFGTVDPGETVPTLHNEMYRAPIFKHKSRPNDFILGYTTNRTDEPKWYLRNIDHVYTVGQTFPWLEVPGPHARKVTNTTKNRLKMIAYRMMKKRTTQDVSLNEITPHVFEKQDPQNRQKMKEFLTYDRDKKTWSLPEGQTLPEESGIRSMIKPEDVCLIESMQVGRQLMENAGYDPKDKEDLEERADEPLVVKMSPWRLTKNFLEATQGKAMVALHGEGDPTGHGQGFSFIKTSMKGGYINAVQGPLATSSDAMERERKANGGHSYNVKKQQDMYNKAIHEIWERQKFSLSDDTTHDDADVLDMANEDDRFNQQQPDNTPAPLDDGRSQFSRLSGASRGGKKKLKIYRKRLNEAGEEVSEVITIHDPVVIRNYQKQKKEQEQLHKDIYSLQATGDMDNDRDNLRMVEKELSRLLKNQDRRQNREKQGKGKKKNTNRDATPDPSSGDKASAGTTRKCANCGQVGHIKTNKR
ncbi:hypothetical protein F4778DRAFT_323468 [Xylariomycetidae sp. FL2044]|nr:hypothetical protein F4778DRAFT_323468 [Xylariomycetidae sp. FL2044]